MNKLRGECEVTYNKKKVGLLFSLYTFMLFCERRGIELDKMADALSKPTSMSDLVWSAIQSNCMDKDITNDFTVIDMPDFLATISDKDQIKISNTIEAVITSFNSKEDDDKKK